MRALLLFLAVSAAWGADAPIHESRFIFEPQSLHSHSSSIVQLPNGDLFTVWYIGSGERKSDDVKLEAARLPVGARTWLARYTIADTPAFPDCNPITFVDSKKRLMLMWPIIVDNNWESAMLQMRISANGGAVDPPQWSSSDPVLLQPRNLSERLTAEITKLLPSLPPGKHREEAEVGLKRATDKLYLRLGWMPRVHPLELPSGRLLVPLYTDTFNMSLIAITDDGGATWTTSEPMVSLGGVQPSLVRRKDGSIMAYMRDNGPAPQRVMISESRDDGMTWSAVTDSDIPNPGSSVEVIALRNGNWVMVNNDSEKSRGRLSLWLSEDEGRTWPVRRALEDGAGSYSYPSMIQAADGSIHVTYSHAERGTGKKQLQSIRHVRVNEAWLRDKQPAAGPSSAP